MSRSFTPVSIRLSLLSLDQKQTDRLIRDAVEPQLLAYCHTLDIPEPKAKSLPALRKEVRKSIARSQADAKSYLDLVRSGKML
jgi:hypothetical protein